jgi:hypothetical protein
MGERDVREMRGRFGLIVEEGIGKEGGGVRVRGLGM